MKGKLTHFAVHTDDIERASGFYEKVFNWSFQNYGPANFKQITVTEQGEEKVIGALQDRSYSPVHEKVVGFECSIAVENVEATVKAVEKAGGKILMPKTEIPYVGWLIKFLDTERNLVCAVQYFNR